MLQVSDLEKSYGAVRALRGVSFHAVAGEVHAIVGENGAGKSTLVKLLTGAVQRDAGSLQFGDHEIATHSPELARELGVRAVYQQPALFPDLTVAENIALALENYRPASKIDWQHRRAAAKQILDRIGAPLHPDRKAATLSTPEQVFVEIAKAIGANPRVLILDEPTACLAARETQIVLRLVSELRSHGAAILYISHRLEELFTVADCVTVVRDGASVLTAAMADLSKDELIRAMVGRELVEVNHSTRPPGGIVLRTNAANGVTLNVHAGEILGLAGLVGSGRTEFADTLFGLAKLREGAIELSGEAVRIDSPEDACNAGIAYVPEDRQRRGVIGELSVIHNMTLPNLRRFSRFGFLDARKEREQATVLAQAVDLRAPSLDAPVSQLSGGNQQKVSFAKWQNTQPKLLIVDEPTQGIDVGAKAEIHGILRGLADRGTAVLMISSDMAEILAVSDRVAVMRAGAISGTLTRQEATPDRILALALPHEAAA